MSLESSSPDLIESPEAAVASMKRQRKVRLVLVLLAIVGALAVAFGASLLMYAEDPSAAPQGLKASP